MTTTPPYTVKVLETCQVSPPSATVVNTSLPLTFLDIIWLTFHPMTRVLFYEFPCSKTNFIQTIIPNLKNSLSLALKHFYPMAGNLITPPSISTTNLEIRYSDADFVSVTFAECTDKDINHLFGHHTRDADVLLPLVAKLPPASSEGDCVITPVLAIQVTLFPDHGISIGFTSSHVLADGRTMFNFIRFWASIANQIVDNNDDEDSNALLLEGLPFYDRSVIQDTKGLSQMFRTAMEKAAKLLDEHKDKSITTTSNKVRATFTITRKNIEGLKNLVLAKRPTLPHVTSFTVVTAYLWTCIAKTRARTSEQALVKEERQHFAFPMDCRGGRTDPPIPATYFGNCLAPCLASLYTAQLLQEGGLVTTAEMIGNAIHSKVQRGVLNFVDKWFEEFGGTLKGEWTMGVSGSPNLDYYNEVDFGWGKAKKFEFVEEPISLSRCKDSVGDLEIGLVMSKNEMELFPSIFSDGLVN